MAFLAPLGLLALLTLPIIVLLHFRRERLRRVVVPSLMLWQYVAPVTGKQRKLLLPLTFLLFLHLLIAALLSIALSRPQWIGELFGSGQEHVIVVLDTSTSMAAQEGFGANRLDQARDHVRGLLDGLGSGDSLSVIAVSSQARLLTSSGASDRMGLLVALEQVDATGTGTDLAEALTLAHAIHEDDRQGREARVVVVSDMEPPDNLARSPVGDQIEWEQVGRTNENRAIVELAAIPQRSGAGGHYVYARIANYEQRSAQVTLRLSGDDELITTRVVDLQASGEAELTWDLPAGSSLLRAEIDGDDALPVDDVASLSLEDTRPVNVVLVSEPSVSINRALAALSALNIQVVTPDRYFSSAPASNTDLTIFNGVMPDELPVGGVLVLNPPAGDHRLLQVEAASPAPEDAPRLPPPEITFVSADSSDNALEGLSLSGIDFGSLPHIQPPEWLQAQVLAGEKPLILHGQQGESEVAVWAFDLSQGNLTSKLAFPLLVARTVRSLTAPPVVASLMVGEPLTLEPNPRTDSIDLQYPDGQTRQMVVSQTLIIEGLTQPGVYTLVEYDGDEIVYQGNLAVNAGTPLESNLRARPMPEAKMPYLALGEAEMEPDEQAPRRDPNPFWPWLAAAALVLLSVEWVYVHWR